jgi:hypothetical protein
MEQLVARFGKSVEALFVLEMITRFARIKLTPRSGGQVITFSVASLLGPSSVISVGFLTPEMGVWLLQKSSRR